jgi:polyphosphate glucokinase
MASASHRTAHYTSQARHVAHAGGVALGIDIGGSGIKGAPVDLSSGALKGERFRLDTPQPAKPRAVADAVGQVVRHFDWSGPIGVTFPGVISRGVVRTAANMDPAWIGLSAADAFGPEIGAAAGTPFVLNDADAAGLAEITHGAAVGQNGVVLMLTFGTGIGSALFVDGHLVPNTEFGHLQVRGKDAELRASAKVREEKNLGWTKWAKRVQEYLGVVDALFSPDLVIIGGGVSKRADKFLPLLRIRAHIVPAQMANDAGIIGAALAAAGAVRQPVSEAVSPAKTSA